MAAISLSLRRCTGCGRLDSAVNVVCPSCLGRDFAEEIVPGDGSLMSWTVIRRPPGRFREDGPYAVAVVDLDAGPRVTGRLTSTDPEGAVPGARVRAVERAGDIVVFDVA